MITIKEIEKIKTAGSNNQINGIFIPLWKDYDHQPALQPRFVYFTSCLPHCRKGPYLHTKRRGLLTLIEGKIIFVYQNKNNFEKIPLTAQEKAVLIDIPAQVGYLLDNPYNEEAKLINICDHPWRADNQETIIPDFKNYFLQQKNAAH